MNTDTMNEAYTRWILQHDTLSIEDCQLIQTHISLLPRRPLLSVVMPTYNTNSKLLSDAISSVRSQLYPFWELCVADDASPSSAVVDLLRLAAHEDGRICWVSRTENGHVSAATNSALALARGEFVVFMDHDDVLPKHALYEVAVKLVANPDADLIYSDEDRIDSEGRRSSPYFKPMWSPELLAGHNMINHLGAYRRTLLEQLGGLREGLEGSQDWDLALRATAAITPDRVHHIPAVLYHWRWKTDTPSFSESSLDRCMETGRLALEDWLKGQDTFGARVEPARLAPGWNRVVYPLPKLRPLVSVIIPTRDLGLLLDRVCEGVLNATEWPAERLELLLVDNGSTEPRALEVLKRLAGHSRVKVLYRDEPFNYSRLNNVAARNARGDMLVLLNNDIEIIQEDWLEEIVRLAWQREVGIAGAKLLYPDMRVQHGGLAMGPGSLIAHVLSCSAAIDPGYMGQLGLTRALSAVTGACMAIRREVFEEAGGLDEQLAVAFNDVDLCLRVRDLGYRVVWTPDAVLVHHESATRGSDWQLRNQEQAHDEWTFMCRRWGDTLNFDPYHNPNILLHGEAGGPLIPAPPRRVPPWRRSIVSVVGKGL